jgi:predicted nucleic acid-binding protein
MIFTDLPAGETVFLDANTLIYHFTHDPVYGAAHTQLLQRIEKQEVRGVTSTHILSETAHRLMTIEAIAAFGWPMAGIANFGGRRRERGFMENTQELQRKNNVRRIAKQKKRASGKTRPTHIMLNATTATNYFINVPIINISRDSQLSRSVTFRFVRSWP